MRFLHTMIRVSDLDQSLRFYKEALGLVEIRRKDYEKGRFSLIFLADPKRAEGVQDGGAHWEIPQIELTYNWDAEELGGGRNFGHLAFEVENIYETCARLHDMGIKILRPPRDGRMAFVRSPDEVSIEFLQSGEALPPQEPWVSMENSGTW